MKCHKVGTEGPGGVGNRTPAYPEIMVVVAPRTMLRRGRHGQPHVESMGCRGSAPEPLVQACKPQIVCDGLNAASKLTGSCSLSPVSTKYVHAINRSVPMRLVADGQPLKNVVSPSSSLLGIS